jgi:hypothetical protein
MKFSNRGATRMRMPAMSDTNGASVKLMFMADAFHLFFVDRNTEKEIGLQK